jgi:hypothetical protein
MVTGQGNVDRTRQNQSLHPSLQDNGISNMSLQHCRSKNRPFALSMHSTSNIKRTSKAHGFKDWKLARKQTTQHFKAFLVYTNSGDSEQLQALLFYLQNKCPCKGHLKRLTQSDSRLVTAFPVLKQMIYNTYIYST